MIELYFELMIILVQWRMMVVKKLMIYHGVFLVLILVMKIEILYRKDSIKRIILVEPVPGLTLVIKKERHFIRIWLMLLTSYSL